MKRQVFYSFHYTNDAMRAMQIRNIGAIEGNQPATPNNWEQIKRCGDASIERWIDNNNFISFTIGMNDIFFKDSKDWFRHL